MEELGTSIADEPLPVPGLTIGNESRAVITDTTPKKGGTDNQAGTKKGMKTRRKHPSCTVERKWQAIWKKRYKLKIKGNKAIDLWC
eukprot:15330117-Ditylum_brightwellii.AAC.1